MEDSQAEEFLDIEQLREFIDIPEDVQNEFYADCDKCDKAFKLIASRGYKEIDAGLHQAPYNSTKDIPQDEREAILLLMDDEDNEFCLLNGDGIISGP